MAGPDNPERLDAAPAAEGEQQETLIVEIDPEKAEQLQEEAQVQAQELAEAEADSREEDDYELAVLERTLESLDVDSTPEELVEKRKAEVAGEAPAEEPAAEVAEGEKAKGKAPSDAEAISGLGETINNASLGMAKDIASAVAKARSKNEESIGFKNSFYLIVLQALSNFTSSASWVEKLTPRELSLLQDKRVGMKVLRDGPNGPALPDSDGKYKVEWTEGIEINVEAMEVFEQAYKDTGNDYLKKLELVEEDTTLADLVKSEDFEEYGPLVEALLEEGAEENTKVLDFIQKNRDGLMDYLTDVSEEGPAVAEASSEDAESAIDLMNFRSVEAIADFSTELMYRAGISPDKAIFAWLEEGGMESYITAFESIIREDLEGKVPDNQIAKFVTHFRGEVTPDSIRAGLEKDFKAIVAEFELPADTKIGDITFEQSFEYDLKHSLMAAAKEGEGPDAQFIQTMMEAINRSFDNLRIRIADEAAPEMDVFAKTDRAAQILTGMDANERDAYTTKVLQQLRKQLEEKSDAELLDPANLDELASMMTLLELGFEERNRGRREIAKLEKKLKVRLEEARTNNPDLWTEKKSPMKVVQNKSKELIQSASA